jgi:hypothetical protein
MRRSSSAALAASQARLLAPGDQVIRYVNGQTFFCMVVSVERDQKIRVSCQLWPSGYTAIVDQRDLTIINYITP